MTSARPPGRAFHAAFARRPLQRMADRGSFMCGEEYAVSGHVGERAATESIVTAEVQGTDTYDVKLWLDDGEPAHSCTCPIGVGGGFCKHAVAVALVVTGAVAEPEQHTEAEVDLRAYLMGLDRDALVTFILDHAAEDDLFDARLRMSAARATAGPPSIAVFRHAINEAFEVDDYIDYRHMYDYVSTIDSTIDSLQQLLDDGHPEAVIALTEHALDRAEDAVGYVDDSDGGMSIIADRLQELHLEACLAARPDPVVLANTLFGRERHSGDLEVFYGAVATYSDVLGPAGVAEYQRLAQQEWDELRPLESGDEGRYSSRRFRITKMMESLAELTGDVDAVVEVLTRDQSSPYQFVRITERYRDAGRHEDALAWAEKGLAMHGVDDLRLVEAAAEHYHHAGRGVDAVRVAWDAYDADPALRTYRVLAEQARRAGLWLDWHDKALKRLRKRAAAAQRHDASILVEVLLHDDDVESAWAEAQRLGCRQDLWLELARRRDAQHPLETIPLWQREIEQVIEAKNNHAYTRAVTLIAHVQHLMTAAGRHDDFASYVAQLRRTHKPKRNLMKLFDERSW